MQAQAPRVSIVVAVHNGAPFIEACVQSLLALDYPRDALEILVVDNGSTDATVALLRRHEPDIRVLHEATRGAAAARNAGIREARGAVVAFTDADCIVEAGWLRALTEPLADGTVGIVGGRICALPNANRIERFGEKIHDHRAALEDGNPPWAISMNWASPAGLLREVGFFDESLLRGQDVDLAFRIHSAGFRLVYAPDARIHHRNEDSFAGLFHEGWVHGRHAIRVLRKHRSIPGNRPMQIWLSILRRLAGNVVGFARRGERFETACALVFDTGKALGHAVGSLEAWAAPAPPPESVQARPDD